MASLSFSLASAATGSAAGAAPSQPAEAFAHACKGSVYLTLDTGSMSEADRIADILRKHAVRATFFLASEKTTRGDRSLDPGWQAWWRARVAEGHAFGSHTLDHVYFNGVSAQSEARPFAVKPQFGELAGQSQRWSAAQVCSEIERVDQRFRELTGRGLDRLWRAPGGRLPDAVDRSAQACGWSHVPWTAAGFLGDELSSEKFPNRVLLERQLKTIGDGDILLAHLGIWSRRDPYAPMLDPLIAGLKARGLCFRTITEHPRWRSSSPS